jgi:hypothetical protein
MEECDHGQILGTILEFAYRTEENHDNLEGWPVSGPRLEPGIS